MKWMSEDNLAYFWSKLKALLSGKKDVQSAKESPSTSGSDIAFIDTISQNANGEITATRKNVREASASQSGVVSTGTQTIAGNKTMTGSLTFDNVANAIRFKNTQNDYPMIKFAGGTDTSGHGLIMGGGGMVVIGSGESSDAIASGKSGGTENTYIGADSEVFVYTNVNGGMTGAKTYTFGSSGTFYSQYLDLRGGASATMTADSTNPKITFSENGSQPVHIIYSDYDSYRAPAGLKVIGGTDATPAWFEVEGDLYTGGSIVAAGKGERTVRAVNTAKGDVDVMLDAGASGNVGVYARGYWDGSAYVASSNWMIVRGSNGKTRLPTSAAGSATRPVYIASDGTVTKCTDSSIALSTYRNTTNTSSAAGTLRKVAGAVMGGGYVVTKVAMAQNTSTTLFTLPTNWRPSETVYGLGMCTTSGTGITVHIDTDGTVKFTSKWGALTTGKEIHFQIAFHTA